MAFTKVDGATLAVVVIGILAIFVGLFFFESWVVETVWNAIAAYFHTKPITFDIAAWIVVGLNLLSMFFRSSRD